MCETRGRKELEGKTGAFFILGHKGIEQSEITPQRMMSKEI